MNSFLALKKTVTVITNSTYFLPLVFKMLVKQRKINVKISPSKEIVKIKQFTRVFGTYSLVATVFDSFLI